MAELVIKDWTESRVMLKYDAERRVRYRVIREGDQVLQQIAELDGSPLYTLPMPEGMKLDTNSFEVMLRYVLLDVLAA